MKDKFTFDMEKIVRTHADMVYRLALLNSKNKHEAEDAMQEVFLKLYSHQNSIRNENHLKAWLIRVTINQCRSMAVTAWNTKRVSLETLIESGNNIPAEEKEDFSEVYEAVKELPAKYRQVIHLFYYEEFSIKEIAAILERNEATVKTHLKRGRKLLEKKLQREWK